MSETPPNNPSGINAAAHRVKRPWLKWALVATAVAATAILGINAASTFFQYRKAGEAWEGVRNDDRPTSGSDRNGTSIGGPLDMYNSDITQEDYGRQLNVTLPYLQDRRVQSMREASDELDLQNRVNPLKLDQLPTDEALRKAQVDQNNIKKGPDKMVVKPVCSIHIPDRKIKLIYFFLRRRTTSPPTESKPNVKGSGMMKSQGAKATLEKRTSSI